MERESCAIAIWVDVFATVTENHVLQLLLANDSLLSTPHCREGF
jgi:hypothetical protein